MQSLKITLSFHSYYLVANSWMGDFQFSPRMLETVWVTNHYSMVQYLVLMLLKVCSVLLPCHCTVRFTPENLLILLHPVQNKGRQCQMQRSHPRTTDSPLCAHSGDVVKALNAPQRTFSQRHCDFSVCFYSKFQFFFSWHIEQPDTWRLVCVSSECFCFHLNFLLQSHPG